MKYFVIILLLVVNSNISIAQVDKTTPVDRLAKIDKTTLVESEFDRPGLILKWSPSPLISFTAPGIQFSLEYPIGKNTEHFFVEHDLGYVYADPNWNNTNTGFRLGTRGKYYFRPTNRKSDNFFTSVMIRHIMRVEKDSDFFERSGGVFEQLFDFKRRFHYTSGYMELGYFTRFGKEGRGTFELLGGAGVIFIKDKLVGVPADAVRIDFNNAFFGELPRDQLLPSIIFNMKFGYILK